MTKEKLLGDQPLWSTLLQNSFTQSAATLQQRTVLAFNPEEQKLNLWIAHVSVTKWSKWTAKFLVCMSIVFCCLEFVSMQSGYHLGGKHVIFTSWILKTEGIVSWAFLLGIKLKNSFSCWPFLIINCFISVDLLIYSVFDFYRCAFASFADIPIAMLQCLELLVCSATVFYLIIYPSYRSFIHTFGPSYDIIALYNKSLLKLMKKESFF